jgi:hypothetical protein
MLEDIFEKALSLLSDGQCNEAALRAACEAAAGELEARLRAGVKRESLGERFVLAAAVLALSIFTQLGESSPVGSFKAGDVSVSRREAGMALNAANALRLQAENMLSGEICDPCFDFRGVSG